MSRMSDLLEQTQALETLINAIVVIKTKDIEADVKRLRTELDKFRIAVSGVPPYIIVEWGRNTTLVISRQAAESCHSVLTLHSKLTNILGVKATHSEVDPKTTEVVRYAPMRVLALFDPKASPSYDRDWFQIAEWDDSISGILSAAIRLKVILG